MTTTPTEWVLPFSGRGINYTEEDIQVVVEAMRNGDPLTQGPKLAQLEQRFSQMMGGLPSFGVSSCTSALELSAVLSRVGPGDEVIIPAHTYCASAIPFARTGARLVWADIEPDTRVVSAETIAALVTEHTKAIVVVHLYGLAAPMGPIMDLAREKGILVIEDCAQAIGATVNGQPVGSIGDFGCFSFHGQKNITTMGEGGILVVRSEETAKMVPGLRHNGHRPYPGPRDHYWVPAMVDTDYDIDGVWPFNYSIGEAQCALGVRLLDQVDEISDVRREKARSILDAVLGYKELSPQAIPDGSTHVYHLLSFRYDGGPHGKSRDDLIASLVYEHRIQAVVQYYPLYRYPLFAKAGFGEANCPNTDHFFDNMLSVPFYPWFEADQTEYLAVRLAESLDKLRKG